MNDGTGDITIRTEPPGAMIYVDSILVTDNTGNPIVTPTKLTLTEGMHRFQLILSGYHEDWEHEYIYCGSDILLERRLMIQPIPGGQMPASRAGFM